ncbi:MAG: hypothetical protein R3C17_07295 [Planctomycetaceae bacterium]
MPIASQVLNRQTHGVTACVEQAYKDQSMRSADVLFPTGAFFRYLFGVVVLLGFTLQRSAPVIFADPDFDHLPAASRDSTECSSLAGVRSRDRPVMFSRFDTLADPRSGNIAFNG